MVKCLMIIAILSMLGCCLYGQESRLDKRLDSVIVQFLVKNKQIEYYSNKPGHATDSNSAYNYNILAAGKGYRIVAFQSFASHSKKYVIIYQNQAVYRIFSGKNLEEEIGYMITFFKKHAIKNKINCYEALLECHKQNMEIGIKTKLIPEK